MIPPNRFANKLYVKQTSHVARYVKTRFAKGINAIIQLRVPALVISATPRFIGSENSAATKTAAVEAVKAIIASSFAASVVFTLVIS